MRALNTNQEKFSLYDITHLLDVITHPLELITIRGPLPTPLNPPRAH